MKTTLFARFRALFVICLVVIVGVCVPSDVYAQLGNVFKRSFTKPPSELFRNTPEMLETEYVCFRVFDGSVADCGFTHKAIGLKQPANDFENNGGHFHNGDRPFGNLKFDGVEVSAKAGIEGQTENRVVTVDHVMPQVSGKMIVERIISTGPGIFCGHDCFTITSWKFEETIEVRISDELIELPPAPGVYIRCAITLGCLSDAPATNPNHPFIFFGKPELVNLIIGLAVMYRSKTNRTLRITDMNLPRGGLFEALEPNWKKPHGLHRRGTSADISRFDPQSREIDQDELDKMIVNRLQLKRRRETSKKECPFIVDPGDPPCIHIEL